MVPVISAASASTGPSTRQAVRKYVEGMEILQKPLLTPLPLLGQASPLGNSTPSLPTVGRHCQGTSKDSESLPVTSTIINQWALGSQSSTFQQLPSWGGGLSPSSLPAQQMPFPPLRHVNVPACWLDCGGQCPRPGQLSPGPQAWHS